MNNLVRRWGNPSCEAFALSGRHSRLRAGVRAKRAVANAHVGHLVIPDAQSTRRGLKRTAGLTISPSCWCYLQHPHSKRWLLGYEHTTAGGGL